MGIFKCPDNVKENVERACYITQNKLLGPSMVNWLGALQYHSHMRIQESLQKPQ